MSVPYSALVSCEAGLLYPAMYCSWADMFCVPMMQCLKNDREIRAWGPRQEFAKHKDDYICFSVKN
jgi:hypothetical protein